MLWQLKARDAESRRIQFLDLKAFGHQFWFLCTITRKLADFREFFISFNITGGIRRGNKTVPLIIEDTDDSP